MRINKLVTWTDDQKPFIISSLFKSATKRVDIFTKSLDPGVYNNLVLKTAVLDFLSVPSRELCVITSGSVTPRLVFVQEILRCKDLESRLSIFNSGNFCNGFPSFYIADQAAYALSDASTGKRQYNSYDPATASKMARLFNRALTFAERII